MVWFSEDTSSRTLKAVVSEDRFPVNGVPDVGYILQPLSGFLYHDVVQHYQPVLQGPDLFTLLEFLDSEVVEGFSVVGSVEEPVESGLVVAGDEGLEEMVVFGSGVGSLD